MAAAFADDLAQLFLRIAKALNEITVAAGLLDGVQVGTLDVLDNRKLKRFLIRQRPDDDGNEMHRRLLSSPPPALARHDFVELFPTHRRA